MHSASSLTSVDSSPDPASCLFAALNELLRAVDGRVVLLRPLTACFDSQRDDVDLLLSESQREQLLLAAFSLCTRERIHCRIQQSSPAKAQLILWTITCSQKLMIDLWTSFDQLPRRRDTCIPAERLLNTLTASVPDTQIHTSCGAYDAGAVTEQSHPGRTQERIPALRQLPPDIDLCLLLQHLAAKRRKLTTTAVRERITRACERFASWSPQQTFLSVPHNLQVALLDVVDHLPRAIMITPKSIALSEEYLLQRLTCVANNRGLPVLARRGRRGLMTGLRRAMLKHRPTVAVIGSDGAGKSSVVSALTRQQPNSTSVVAKKFYRHSLTYQFFSGLMKRLFGTDRGVFDDHTAPLITLRAAAVSCIRMSVSFNPWSMNRRSVADKKSLVPDQRLNKLLHFAVFDRSISSFLITHRKSDTPNLTHGATWIESFIPPVTSVLLTLPHSELIRRKQEMSALGHDAYQRMLFGQALRQQPGDLILLASQPSAQAAAMAICELLRHDTRSDESLTVTAGSGREAA
ncbi:MAG: hypothetical protein WKF77_11185 [Planctomycetaceae bacterium]